MPESKMSPHCCLLAHFSLQIQQHKPSMGCGRGRGDRWKIGRSLLLVSRPWGTKYGGKPQSFSKERDVRATDRILSFFMLAKIRRWLFSQERVK